MGELLHLDGYQAQGLYPVAHGRALNPAAGQLQPWRKDPGLHRRQHWWQRSSNSAIALLTTASLFNAQRGGRTLFDSQRLGTMRSPPGTPGVRGVHAW